MQECYERAFNAKGPRIRIAWEKTICQPTDPSSPRRENSDEFGETDGTERIERIPRIEKFAETQRIERIIRPSSELLVPCCSDPGVNNFFTARVFFSFFFHAGSDHVWDNNFSKTARF